jgi:hypothetical protein
VRQQNECRYGPDGEIVKTQFGAPPESGGKKKRGLKGKIVAKKVGELKECMDRAGSLIRRYVPPDAAQMKSAFDSGKAALSRNAADSSITIEFKDYFTSGDLLVLSFSNGPVKSVAVKSYLDDASDAVSVSMRHSNFMPTAPTICLSPFSVRLLRKCRSARRISTTGRWPDSKLAPA